MAEDAPTLITLYMPVNPTEREVSMAEALCDDENVVDDQGMSNKDKWERVLEVFRANNATLFSQIDFTETYMTDDSRRCEAAYFICDLRRQFLRKLMQETGRADWMLLHICYVNTMQAHKPLYERVRLDLWQRAAKVVSKAH